MQASLIHQRAESRRTKNYNSAACRTKTTLKERQTDKMKRQRTMYQMKEQDKTPEKQLKEVEIDDRQPSRKRIQNNGSE